MMGALEITMSNDPDETRERLGRAGLAITDEEWEALPKVARKRLREHPDQTASERERLAALLRWLLWEFPPGWSRREP